MIKPISVVVADSSEDFRSLLSEYINAEEDMCVAADIENGASAERCVVELKPDVLITDLVLRETDGFALLSRLNVKDMMPYTIVISGFFNDDLAERAGKLGVKRFFTKPCQVRAVIECIRDGAVKSKAESEKRAAAHVRQMRLETEKQVDEIMRFSGVLPHLWGFQYLLEGLVRVWSDRGKLVGVTKVLYPELAEHFGTTPENLERCIRNALDIAWRDGDRGKRGEFFGPEFAPFLEKRPGNVRFMKIVVDFMEKQNRA